MDLLKKAYHECYRISKEKAKNFHYASIFLPRHVRYAGYVIYSFCGQADEISDGDLDLHEKIKRLNHFEESFEKSLKGNIQNNIFLALKDVIDKYNLNPEFFRDIIRGVRMDLLKTRFETFEELYDYCYKVSVVISLILAQVLGLWKEEYVRKYIKNAEYGGVAIQLTNILRDIKEDAERNRIYLPLEDLKRFNYSEGDLLAFKYNENFINLMKFEVDRIKHFFELSDSGLSSDIIKKSRLLFNIAF